MPALTRTRRYCDRPDGERNEGGPIINGVQEWLSEEEQREIAARAGGTNHNGWSQGYEEEE